MDYNSTKKYFLTDRFCRNFAQSINQYDLKLRTRVSKDRIKFVNRSNIDRL